MNKEKLTTILNTRLDLFTAKVKEEEKKKILDLVIDNEQKGMSETEAIKSLGNLDDVINNIYKNHGIDPKKVIKKKDFFYKKFTELFEVIHHVIDVSSKNDFQSNMKIIFDMVILLGFVCILKIPFILIRNLGDSLILYLNIPVISDIWGLLIDFIYINVAIMFFMNIFTKYFKNIKETKNTKLKKEELKSINLEEK